MPSRQRNAPRQNPYLPSLKPRRNDVYPHPPKPPVLCPVCRVPSRREQERKRHLLLHLPTWILCSVGPCSWRGDRLDIFKKHLFDEHQIQVTRSDGYLHKIYDPLPLVKGLIMGSTSIGDAANDAIKGITQTAQTLNKPELLKDPWGRKGKNAPGDEYVYSVPRRGSYEV